MPKFIIRQKAKKQILEAYYWHENQIETLGVQFYFALEACFSLIQRHPLAFPKIYRETHRALLRRFPYSLFYLIKENKIIVLGCLHNHENPKKWP